MANRPGKRQETLNWYLSLVVLVLTLVVPPVLCGLFYLSQVPDITWNRGDGLTYDRIWLHRDRRPVGIGYQSHRVIATYSNTEVCVENRLRFLLWGKSPNAQPSTSSQMMVLTATQWHPNGQACP